MTLKSPASPFYSPRTTPLPPNSNALSNIPILTAAFLAILSTGGPTYSFGVYSATLKRDLNLSQSQLETLGSASFAAGVISWIPGLAVDEWGSRAALTIGGCLQSCGLILYWTVARFRPLPENYVVPTLALLSVLIFTANNCVIGGVFKSIVVTCRLGTKGKAVGAAKAYLGLGAGVFASLFRAVPFRSDLDFLAMSSLCALAAIVLPAAISLPSRAQMEKQGTKDESTRLHYNVVYAGLLVLCLVVVGTSAMDLFSFPTTTSSLQLPEWLHGVIILMAWMGPILALFLVPTQSTTRKRELQKQQSFLRRKARQAMEQQQPHEGMRLLSPQISSNVRGGAIPALSFQDSFDVSEPPQETPQPVPDLTLLEMLQTVRAWLFLGASTILVGAGTMLTINMGQLVGSQRHPPETAAACLSMFSVAQALARVTAGALSESALQWKRTGRALFGIQGGGVPRPAFLVLSCAFAVTGHAILATMSSRLHWFVLGIVLTGISFGSLWPLMVLIIGDLFGTVNHGANYMFADGFTCAAGTLSVAKFLTQYVYEKHVAMQSDVNDIPAACYGDECFRTTHGIISGMCVVSLLACTALLYMTRTSYGSLVG